MNLYKPPVRDNYIYGGKPVVSLAPNWIRYFDSIYHEVSNIITEIERERTITSVSGSITLNETHGTVVVTVSGLTITLPVITALMIGKDWTVIFATTGTCTINCSAGASFPAVTSATETTASIVSRGTSLTFRCTSLTTWGVV